MSEKYWAGLPLQAITLKYALREYERGVEEEDENDSPAIRRYLEAGGIDQPAPWCAAFVNWAAERAAMLKGVASPLEEIEHQAYVESYVRWARDGHMTVPAGRTAPGDLFALYDRTAEDPVYEETGRHVHIGFVKRPGYGSGEFMTCEGNTPDEEGDEEVEVKRRSADEGVTFMRWAR